MIRAWKEYADDRKRKEKSEAIDRKIEADSKRGCREVKLLMLGGSGSGKSTLVQRMKVNDTKGFSAEGLAAFRPVVHRTAIELAQAIVCAMEGRHGLPYNHAQHVIANYQLPEGKELDSEVANTIRMWWQDPTVSQFVEEDWDNFELVVSAKHIIPQLERISSADYLPTIFDVMYASLRMPSENTSIVETCIAFERISHRIHIHELTPHLANCQKWRHCFENATTIIFCVALSDYDKVLPSEDEEVSHTAMTESLSLFSSLVNSEWFRQTSFILFLNKIDVFTLKLEKVPLETHFPAYTDGNNVNKAVHYILAQFMHANTSGQSIYACIGRSTDNTTLQMVHSVIKETILRNALKESGIIGPIHRRGVSG